ncbi:MAG: response regulator transcription factor [Kovacikia sp.]
MALTILVADDDLGTRLSISDYLEAAGYFVISAENGQEALRLVDNYQPHLIVTDITMPQMDGWELVRQIRQRPALRLLPVVFLTARTETQERVRGYQLGCDLFLAKPFELRELGAVVRNLLERQQMIESERRFSNEEAISTDKNLRMPALSIAPDSSAKHSFHSGYSITPRRDLDLHLTQREQEVLRLVSDGLSNVQIGDHLHLSPRTIEKHVSSLLKKTETSNRAELVRFAMEHHLME